MAVGQRELGSFGEAALTHHVLMVEVGGGHLQGQISLAGVVWISSHAGSFTRLSEFSPMQLTAFLKDGRFESSRLIPS